MSEKSQNLPMTDQEYDERLKAVRVYTLEELLPRVRDPDYLEKRHQAMLDAGYKWDGEDGYELPADITLEQWVELERAWPPLRPS